MAMEKMSRFQNAMPLRVLTLVLFFTESSAKTPRRSRRFFYLKPKAQFEVFGDDGSPVFWKEELASWSDEKISKDANTHNVILSETRIPSVKIEEDDENSNEEEAKEKHHLAKGLVIEKDKDHIGGFFRRNAFYALLFFKVVTRTAHLTESNAIPPCLRGKKA